MSAEVREHIVDAVAEDLREKSGRRLAALNQAASVEERLAKLENRMRVLAEVSQASGTAVKALKKDTP
jgi:hypothetical protein